MINASIPNMSRAIMSRAMHCMSYSSCTIKGNLEKNVSTYVSGKRIDPCFWRITHTLTVRGVFESQIPCIRYITHTLTVKGTLKIQGRTNSCFKNIDSNIQHACMTNMSSSMHLIQYSYIDN